MRVSGNELSVTVTKACIGAGVARGVAEDIGKAVLELPLVGEDALGGLLMPLDEQSAAAEPAVLWKEVSEGWQCDEVRVLSNGPALIDFAVVAGVGKSTCAVKVDHSDLLRGLAAASAWDIELTADKSGGLVARLLAAEPKERTLVGVFGCEVDDVHWQSLCAHAAEILVPADATNRADAGAGLTDND